MTVPWAAGSHIFLRSSIVIVSATCSRGERQTVRASKQTGSSMYSTLFSAAVFISSAEMGREALEMSISPRQNFLKPPPVPEMPTVALMPLLAFWNSSATASVTG